MCGIIAIIDKTEEIFNPAIVGLMSLQHRGQDACGLITCKDNELFIKKEMDSIHRVFKSRDAGLLKGKFGIGHTRYATQGKATIKDAQPLISNTNPQIALAQNGNTINYFSLKQELSKEILKFETTVDTEIMLLLFSLNYEKYKDFFEASKQILEKVKGGYAIVGVIADKGIFAIRDPRGIRPLVLGKKNDSYVIASETVAFQKMGYEYVRDIKPGEAILINKDLEIEHKVLTREKPAHCMFEWVYFSSPNSMIEGRSVYKARLALGKLLSKTITKADIDIIAPVPDSGRTTAIKLSEDAGIKYREGLIKDRYVPRTFIMASQKMREKAVDRKLMPIISILQDKNVAIVDDSIVRGTTSKKIIESLKDGGVKETTFISSCPPIKYPCYYGIDIATKEELIASDKSIEEIKNYLGTDHLIYSTVDDIKTAIRREVCMACITGEYPEKILEEQKQSLGCQRSEEQTKLDNKLNVLIIGSGGREHSLALKVSQSPHLNRLFAIPGNPGIQEIAECHDIDKMDNSAIVEFAKQNKIDLVIVGPEDPLSNGIVDALEQNRIKAFGPNKIAAQFESSKAFARRFMKKYGLPTVEFEEFTDFDKAKEYIQEKGVPIVIKADGLAAGKGVFVAQNKQEAIDFAEQCLIQNKFGKASSSIVVEECLFGEEGSYLVFMDSKTYKPMVYSQDHKPIYEGDKGPNTGGMGTYSPAPILDGYEQEIQENIMKPFLDGIKQEGIDFKGILYVGLMKTKDGLKILEFNCRFGDPETQVILPRLKTDLLEVIQAVNNQELDKIELEWSDQHCVCVAIASQGYPGSYEKGKLITGLENLDTSEIIHAGTKKENNQILTNGGRVLNIVCLGDTLQQAIDNVYSKINKVHFDGMYFRCDIAKKELDRQEGN